jgi:hypothetical protein
MRNRVTEPRIVVIVYLYQYKTERGDEWATMVVQAIIGAFQMMSSSST